MTSSTRLSFDSQTRLSVVVSVIHIPRQHAQSFIVPLHLAWLFELAGGAVADYTDTCLPKSQREAAFTIAALHQWEMDIDDDRCVDSAEEVSH